MIVNNIDILDLKIENNELSNREYTHFTIREMTYLEGYNDFITELSDATSIDMSPFYYCMPRYIECYIFVIIWSGRTNAVYTSNLISNFSNHELRDIKMVGHDKNCILLVFKNNKIK